MHLTPEQIERHPFRMRKRGYDISQVRELLRDIAAQMRENADDERGVLTAARAEAESIIEAAEAEARRRSDEVLRQTQARLDELLDEERLVRERMLAADTTPVVPVAATEHPTRPHDVADEPNKSLADFMKSAVRDDVR